MCACACVCTAADGSIAEKEALQTKIESLEAEVVKVKKQKRASAKMAAQSMEKANAMMAGLAEEGESSALPNERQAGRQADTASRYWKQMLWVDISHRIALADTFHRIDDCRHVVDAMKPSRVIPLTLA
jgi:hypothetical protein